MSDEKKVKVERLELNKETVADLTEQEAEGVDGGRAARRDVTKTCPGCCIEPSEGCARAAAGTLRRCL
jgi:hypothetical protein